MQSATFDSNFFNNVGDVWNLANNVAQGKVPLEWARAVVTLGEDDARDDDVDAFALADRADAGHEGLLALGRRLAGERQQA